VYNVSRRARIIVQANRALLFVCAAADIENFHLNRCQMSDARCQILVRNS
jgi:hypothetical protein